MGKSREEQLEDYAELLLQNMKLAWLLCTDDDTRRAEQTLAATLSLEPPSGVRNPTAKNRQGETVLVPIPRKRKPKQTVGEYEDREE